MDTGPSLDIDDFPGNTGVWPLIDDFPGNTRVWPFYCQSSFGEKRFIFKRALKQARVKGFLLIAASHATFPVIKHEITDEDYSNLLIQLVM